MCPDPGREGQLYGDRPTTDAMGDMERNFAARMASESRSV